MVIGAAEVVIGAAEVVIGAAEVVIGAAEVVIGAAGLFAIVAGLVVIIYWNRNIFVSNVESCKQKVVVARTADGLVTFDAK